MSDEQKREGLTEAEAAKDAEREAAAESAQRAPEASGSPEPAASPAEQQPSPRAEATEASAPQAPEPAAEPAPAAAEAVPAPEAPAAKSEPPPATEATTPASAAPNAEAQAAAPVRRQETDEEKAARRKAALEAREAAKAALAGGKPAAAPGADGGAPQAAAEAPPKPPSPNQPRLDRAVQLLREQVAEDAVEEASVNEPNDHLPTLVIRADRWYACAELFRSHPELNIDYLRNVAGVDQETHMEVVYHLLSLTSGHVYAVRVRTDREQPSVPSVTPIWQAANWNEREIYDLLGIDFPGHPDLRRIMMPDDWVGHPLRKDYVPLDPEV